jgi:Uma2 family endonuclease
MLEMLAPPVDHIKLPDDFIITGKVVARDVDYDTFLATEYGDVHVEWVNGVVIEMASITEAHDELMSFLKWLLRTFLIEIIGSGRVLGDPMVMKLEVVPSSRVPDLQVLLPERLHQLKNNQVVGPANAVIEIVSPGSRRTDYVEKRHEYELGKVPEYWIFDPQKRSTTFLRMNAEGLFDEILPDDSGVYLSAALPGFRLDTSILWDTTVLSAVHVATMIEQMKKQVLNQEAGG